MKPQKDAASNVLERRSPAAGLNAVALPAAPCQYNALGLTMCDRQVFAYVQWPPGCTEACEFKFNTQIAIHVDPDSQPGYSSAS